MKDALRLLPRMILVALLALTHGKAAPPPPDIVVILAHDLGHADLGCHRSRDFITPNIDSLAANAILRNDYPVDEQEYLTKAFSREAAAFIDRHHEQPFFLYVAYNAIHIPHEVPEEYLRRFAHVKSPTRQPRDRVAAMAAVMDEGVGTILATLREQRLDERTLIFFLSDNGGQWRGGWGDTHNGPLRGTKGEFYEGGIRIPFLMQWKGRLPVGTIYRGTASALDIAATALAAAGADLNQGPTLDGVDLVRAVADARAAPPPRTLFWRMGGAGALRAGPWKLVKLGPRHAELFNLDEDLRLLEFLQSLGHLALHEAIVGHASVQVCMMVRRRAEAMASASTATPAAARGIRSISYRKIFVREATGAVRSANMPRDR